MYEIFSEKKHFSKIDVSPRIFGVKFLVRWKEKSVDLEHVFFLKFHHGKSFICVIMDLWLCRAHNHARMDSPLRGFEKAN